MYTYEGYNANEVYPKIIKDILKDGEIVPSRNGETLELHPAVIEIDNIHERLVTSYGRPVNVAFALAEVLWILAGKDEVAMLNHYNSTIKNYSDDGVTFNAAYGKRLRNFMGIDQIEDVIRTLKDDPESRQATLVISNPMFDKGWQWLPDVESSTDQYVKRVTRDRACNIVSHLLIRDGKLDWLQVLRSNDALWGTPYNLMQFSHIMEYIATAVGVPMGRYVHTVDSLHIYDYHWEEAKDIAPFDIYEHIGTFQVPHAPMKEATPEMIHELSIIESDYRAMYHEDPQKLSRLYNSLGDIFRKSEYWHEVLGVLLAHSLYKLGEDIEALSTLFESDYVYGAAQCRFYWENRWYRHDKRDAIYRLIEEKYPKEIIEWITRKQEK